MAKFVDGKAREWWVGITVGQLRAVRERCDFDLGKLLADDAKRLTDLGTDPELLVNVLFVLCSDQAAKDGITEEAFGRGLTGDALEHGFDALLDAYADFCPSRQARPLRALLAKTKEVADRRLAEVMAKIDGVGDSTSNGSPGSARASADSTPAG